LLQLPFPAGTGLFGRELMISALTGGHCLTNSSDALQSPCQITDRKDNWVRPTAIPYQFERITLYDLSGTPPVICLDFEEYTDQFPNISRSTFGKSEMYSSVLFKHIRSVIWILGQRSNGENMAGQATRFTGGKIR
jgi:hypothetical protein